MAQPTFRIFANNKSVDLRLAPFVIPQQRFVFDELTRAIQQYGAMHLSAGAYRGDLRADIGETIQNFADTVADRLPPQRRCLFRPACTRSRLLIFPLSKPHERTIGPQDGGAGTPVPTSMVNILFFITDSGDIIRRASGPQAQVLTGVQFREEVGFCSSWASTVVTRPDSCRSGGRQP
jgi:hypothetical protein